MALLVVGLNHKTAPVALRERLAFAGQTLAEPLAQWHDSAVEEVVILSTCNRVECYLQGPDAGAGARCCIDFLATYHGLPEAQFVPHLYQLHDVEAVRHLFRVASGLDSLVLEALSVGLVNKLLHVPTVNLKRSFREGRALDYVQLVRHLFALDP